MCATYRYTYMYVAAERTLLIDILSIFNDAKSYRFI